MATAGVNGIEICYETFGDPGDPPILLIGGLGTQMLSWDVGLVEALAERGHLVIRFDNRDAGLSTSFPPGPAFSDAAPAILTGEMTQDGLQYTLSDMAADNVALLRSLGIDAAHVVGASMGGMIAQLMAIEHPDHTASLCSIMSTTGDPDVGQPTQEALAVLMEPPPKSREEAIAANVRASHVIGTPGMIDEARVAARAGACYDRDHHPAGVANQLLAVLATPPRSERLGSVTAPTIVIHGDADPLVPLSGGQRTAEAVPGATLHVIEGMGHDLPEPHWPLLVDLVSANAAAATSGGVAAAG